MRAHHFPILGFLVIPTAVIASSDHSGSNNKSPFFYKEIHYSDDEMQGSDVEDRSEAPSVVASSLLYDGGCYVSSEAMMISGGEGFMNFEFDSDEAFSDDEENDDDDDDGHSSMLSNASLKRSKVLADGSNSGAGPTRSSSPASISESQSVFMEGEIHLKKQKQQSAIHSALLVRGGGVTSSLANNELAKRLLVAAIVTLVFEGCIGHVLEFFKIVMQTSPPGTTYLQVFKEITSEKGIAGLWDGFVPWGVVQSILKGGVFGLAQASASKVLKPLANDGVIPMQLAMTLAGGIGGGFQGYVLSPTLLMKTRVMTNPVFREKMSMLKTTWLSFTIGADVVKNEGIMTLMKGSNVFATKRVFDWSSRYFFSDLFESAFIGWKGSALTPLEKSLASFLGGVASTCVTLPLDVLVAKAQDAKNAGVKTSAFKMFKDELDAEGWSGLRARYMQGFEARLLHVCLTTVVLKTGAPIVYDMIFGEQ